MLHENRRTQRYAMPGMAALVRDGHALVGHISDISQGGIALDIPVGQDAGEDIDKLWLCRVVSPELPETMEFFVRVVRPRDGRQGYGLACVVDDMSGKDRALFDAFRHRRLRAVTYH